MVIDRKLWDISSISEMEKWPCPSCKNGTLGITKDKISDVETGASLVDQKRPTWEPGWVRGRFSAMMKCADCGEVVVVSGDSSVSEFGHPDDLTGEEYYDAFTVFTVKYIYPAPPIFLIPDKCSKATRRELEKAFSQFWSDTSACANNMRCAVEAIMNDLKMRKKRKTKAGKFEILTLHKRIEEFKVKNLDAGKLLLGVKWLGNGGSHTSDTSFTRSEILDGFEVLEGAIDRIYVQSDQRLNMLAKRMTAKRGTPQSKT
ncbi:MAG: DUF4145 domain-containing protein [Rhodobacteraceae bacterium]|nr:DUF4145 domain-containing protein [Paracoccaceae bacterium]